MSNCTLRFRIFHVGVTCKLYLLLQQRRNCTRICQSTNIDGVHLQANDVLAVRMMHHTLLCSDSPCIVTTESCTALFVTSLVMDPAAFTHTHLLSCHQHLSCFPRPLSLSHSSRPGGGLRCPELLLLFRRTSTPKCREEQGPHIHSTFVSYDGIHGVHLT
jgi:hypothetical protein